MRDPYVPVSCALHSALELAALQHKSVVLQMRDGSQMKGKILDVWTADGREWLKLRRTHQEQVIDLTLIDHLQESFLHEH
ncbi:MULTISPECIES: Rho-binding antiterminator [Acidithiobacillus]|jgi:Rho-binding antiterminator|uniref:Transcriptional antiterminator, Rof n=1 Tax=Acidithiobacillus thiooxidans ATCC 19377 TaxID=637390 RepID=A0A5P9XLY5_ACITH|nr:MULTISPECIES: Rho-binding antiterminator [Acidithiobacillus]MBU2740734.1 transcriptional antiterminator, Rof [Acidithiobacillus albertensis]MBU2837536.1 transcriptional antiterminator, Rof [Acidithiobacillus thiooxidans]QFX94987.1 transcriptional antiterminator, Rof [Acidithiobacillus thiooxidans ATCC 19377]